MNRVTVLFCVYLHNPSLPWPSYTSQSLHFYAPPPTLTWFMSVLRSTPLSLSFFSILSACYINDTRVTEGKSSSTRRHHHHHRVNLTVTLDTQFVRIIFKFVSHLVSLFCLPPPLPVIPCSPPPTLAQPHPWSWDLVLIFCWDGRFQGSGFGSRAQKQRVYLAFL